MGINEQVHDLSMFLGGMHDQNIPYRPAYPADSAGYIALEIIVPVAFPEWLSPVADVLSVFGFALTIWVLKVTSSLKRSFALRARTPELRKSLAASARKLPPLLAVWPQSKNETLAVLAHTRALLVNLSTKLPRNERGPVNRLASSMRGRRSGFFSLVPASNYSADEHWEVFAELQGIIATLEQREKDATWE